MLSKASLFRLVADCQWWVTCCGEDPIVGRRAAAMTCDMPDTSSGGIRTGIQRITDGIRTVMVKSREE